MAMSKARDVADSVGEILLRSTQALQVMFQTSFVFGAKGKDMVLLIAKQVYNVIFVRALTISQINVH